MHSVCGVLVNMERVRDRSRDPVGTICRLPESSNHTIAIGIDASLHEPNLQARRRHGYGDPPSEDPPFPGCLQRQSQMVAPDSKRVQELIDTIPRRWKTLPGPGQW